MYKKRKRNKTQKTQNKNLTTNTHHITFIEHKQYNKRDQPLNKIK